MLCHESLESYYRNTQRIFFRPQDGYSLNFSLSDFESMVPYEREIYLILMNQTIEEVEASKPKNTDQIY